MTNDDQRETGVANGSDERRIGRPTRRTFLKAAAAGSAATGLGVAAGQDDTPTEEGTPEDGNGFFRPGTEVGVQTVAEGMTAPTDFAVAEDGRYFVTDQTGEVWVVTEDGRQEEPFIDVSDRLVTLGEFNGQYADPQQDYDERGLLGIAVHPEFGDNGRFYLHYSAPPNDETPEDWDHVEIVSEFQLSEDGGAADPESERVLLSIQSPQYNHDSGPMAFGPDGYLYVPMGDGGGANDDMYGHVEDWYDENSGGNGQDVEENMLGSVLRIDVNEEGEETPYAIPDDNPLDPGEFDFPEQYAWGFRNPFGIDFDSDGRLFVADAGQNLFEEASVVEAGGNYGWNVLEGTHCFSTDSPSEPPEDCPDSAPDEAPYDGQELIDPIVEYPHTYQGQNVGIVIAGGHFYENDTIPDLQGKYIFGDWTMDPGREEPLGRLLAATDPEAGDGTPEGETPTEGTPEEGTPTPEDGTPEDGTPTPEGTSTPEGTPTPGEETELALQDETPTPTPEEGTPTPTPEDGDGTETTTPGKATPGGEAPETPQEEVEIPRDQLWDMEELVVAGGQEGTLGYFVRQFGQDEAGEIYVLANQRGVPEGDTGVVMRLVPPDEGETITPEEGTPTEGTPEEGTPENGPPEKETPGDGTPEDGTPTETPTPEE
jgi:glucose/arabinose dehydrogenase